MENIMYVVMKLNTVLNVTDNLGNVHELNLDTEEVAGHIIAYKTYGEAFKASKEGKFDIVQIRLVNE